MLQDTPNESNPTQTTTDDTELREGESISVYPITRDQWDALRTIAFGLGCTRSDLFREAINQLLDERDDGQPVRYTAAPRLLPDEKVGIKPRIVWLKDPLLERFRRRCEEDRVSQSEFILDALRNYLEDRGIEIEPEL